MNEMNNQELRDKLFHAGHEFVEEKAKLRAFETRMTDDLNTISDCLEMLLESIDTPTELQKTLSRAGVRRSLQIQKNLKKLTKE